MYIDGRVCVCVCVRVSSLVKTQTGPVRTCIIVMIEAVVNSRLLTSEDKFHVIKVRPKERRRRGRREKKKTERIRSYAPLWWPDQLSVLLFS